MKVHFLRMIACLPLALVLSAAADPPPAPSRPPKLIRSFVLQGVDPQVARAELVRFPANTSPGDLVDLVAEFIPSYGQANNMLPLQMGPAGLTSVLFQFKDKRAIAALVRSGEGDGLAGPHGCRIFMDPNKGKPSPVEFSKIVHWCANAISLANIDPAAIAAGSP